MTRPGWNRRLLWHEGRLQRDWLGLTGLPRRVLRRELGLLLLPALLSVSFLLLATQPAYRALDEHLIGWHPYAYQALAQDVQAALSAHLDRRLSEQERRDAHDRALSGLLYPAQFPALAEVESYGEAKLEDIRRALQEDTLAGHRRAVEGALHLSAQAQGYAHELNARTLSVLRDLQRALLLGSLGTGVLSMLLIVRALLMWRAERERRATREARQREALSLANHELRRPLQALMLIGDLLRHTEEPEKRAQLLNLLDDQVEQLDARSDLTRLNDLYLDVTLRVTRTDLRQLVERLREPRVVLRLPLGPLMWPVDPARLRQVMENLIENALHYTTGEVEVTLALVAGRPQLTVRDHGPGLSEELHERIFLPYERGPRGLSEGRGLGLPLVRRYARAHGGDVSLRNAPEGGLIVTVWLGQPSALLTESARTSGQAS